MIPQGLDNLSIGSQAYTIHQIHNQHLIGDLAETNKQGNMAELQAQKRLTTLPQSFRRDAADETECRPEI